MQRKFLKITTLIALAMSMGGLVNEASAMAASSENVRMDPEEEYEKNLEMLGMPVYVPTPKEPNEGEPGARIRYFKDSPIHDYSKDSIKNSRDLAGYTPANGQWKIKEHKLIRSMALNSNLLLPEDGVMLAKFYDVKSVIDFRVGDINYNHDVSIPEVDKKVIPIDPSRHSWDIDIYGEYFTHTTEVDAGYSDFFKSLMDHEGATLYYDHNGSSSVGIATYLLMNVLGMSQDTQIHDFTLSNLYNQGTSYYQLAKYAIGIHKYRGNMKFYLEDGLGITPDKREALRAKYLISTDGKNTPYTTAANKPLPEKPVKPTPTPTPTPVPTPTKPTQPSTSQPGGSTAVKPTPVVPAPEKPTTSHKPSSTKKKVKVLSVKKVKHGRYVFTKDRKPTFKDVKLKHQRGKTKAKSKTQYRIIKIAKLKVNGKKATYIQVKSHHGKPFWISQQHVLEKLR